MRLTFQQLKKCNSRNYEIGAVRVWLFSLKLSSGANQKKKEKVVGLEILKKKKKKKKKIEPGVYHNLLQEMHINDRESHFRLFV